MVDKVTSWFVPAVMAAAFATFLVWFFFGPDPALTFGLVNAVAVLIIACPCAMGLATPTSIMVGTGRAAELGVLFRKGEALQTLKSAEVIALRQDRNADGRTPRMTDFDVAQGFDHGETLSLVAAVESQSEHPIATAIVNAAKAEGHVIPAVSDFEAIPGYGAAGTVRGAQVSVGADRYMQRLGSTSTVSPPWPNGLGRRASLRSTPRLTEGSLL